MRPRLCVIGGGRMGSALVGGLIANGWARPDELLVVEKLSDLRRATAERFPGIAVSDELSASAGAVVAVKPGDAEAVCRAVGPLADRVLSIAAGIGLETLESWLGGEVPVVRAMPNIAAVIGEGAAAISPGASAGEDDLLWAESILASVGRVWRLPEHLLDAVTGLSGSGPAWVFVVAEALEQAGVAEGLPPEASKGLVAQTLLGAARMLVETGQEPSALREAVTSPGGTTEAGLVVLEARSVRSALVEAVAAATERSRELGGWA